MEDEISVDLSFETTVPVAWYDHFDSRHDEDEACIYTDGECKYVVLPLDAEIHEIVLKSRD